MKLLLQLLAIVTVFAANAQGTFEGITGYSQSIVGTEQGTSGWTFQTANGIVLTALGAFDYLVGAQGPISVGLWNSSGTLLASHLVASSSSLTNQTRYESITPILLSPGQVYTVGAYSSSGSLLLQAFFPGSGGSVSTSSDILLRGYANNPSASFGFPTEIGGASGGVLFGPNFLYHEIPEPDSIALVCMGGLACLGLRGRRQP